MDTLNERLRVVGDLEQGFYVIDAADEVQCSPTFDQRANALVWLANQTGRNVMSFDRASFEPASIPWR